MDFKQDWPICELRTVSDTQALGHMAKVTGAIMVISRIQKTVFHFRLCLSMITCVSSSLIGYDTKNMRVMTREIEYHLISNKIFTRTCVKYLS